MVRAIFIFLLVAVMHPAWGDRPLEGLVICLDPGHGGQERDSEHYIPGVYTGGTFGVATGQTEGDVNLRVANKLTDVLRRNGASVVLTRQHRGRIMNRECEPKEEIAIRAKIAAMYNPDVFISIHHNDAGRKSPNYTTVFYGKNGIRPELLAKSTAIEISRQMGTKILPASRGEQYRLIKTADAIMPDTLTILAEASFMSNPDEDRKLAGEKRIEEEAMGIYNGIVNYRACLQWHNELEKWCQRGENFLYLKMKNSSLQKAVSTTTKIFTLLASELRNTKAPESK